MMSVLEAQSYWHAYIIARNKLRIARFLGWTVSNYSNDNQCRPLTATDGRACPLSFERARHLTPEGV